jgi:hypothetical protein
MHTVKRRHTERRTAGKPLRLKDGHRAVEEARSLFREMVRDDWKRILIGGENNRKIGSRVAKGPWTGLPLHTLTLEERATCPRECHHWATCYGNKMRFARRHAAGPDFVRRLGDEIAALAEKHPEGFVVRTHVLGDYYSVGYVDAWRGWLRSHPNLRVYGYTAWPPSSEIGMAVSAMVAEFGWERAAVRFSGGRLETRCAHPTSDRNARGHTADGIVCPVQSGDCETCGACTRGWATEANIVCVDH